MAYRIYCKNCLKAVYIWNIDKAKAGIPVLIKDLQPANKDVPQPDSPIMKCPFCQAPFSNVMFGFNWELVEIED